MNKRFIVIKLKLNEIKIAEKENLKKVDFFQKKYCNSVLIDLE